MFGLSLMLGQSSRVFPATAPLTSWFESPGNFGGGDWPPNVSAGTSGLRPSMTHHNNQPTVSTAAYNGHNVPSFLGSNVEDFWGNPNGAILMSDIVSAGYGEIHFLAVSVGPALTAAANPYDDANIWSDGTAVLTMGCSITDDGIGNGNIQAYLYDGVAYQVIPAQTWPYNSVNYGRMIWDGTNLTLDVDVGGSAGTNSVACGSAFSLAGNYTLGFARTTWWTGDLLSILTSQVPLGLTFKSQLKAYWNKKFGLSL